ncbi:MAG: hypothetical protein HY726_23250 [Candidatus Rokubacteria bacterium]|nr:hypothetical protein [Candidatus Rokubacteria bacterium]
MGAWPVLLLLALLAWGCATPAPATFRHPDFRPDAIRRPAVLIRVSLDRTAAPGDGGLSPRARSPLADAFEIGFLEGLNARGILPLDTTLSAHLGDRPLPVPQAERQRALERARALKADAMLIVSVVVSRLDLVYCRDARRPFAARTTLWTVSAEVLRVADGARLLFEPPSPGLRLTDVEPDCDAGRIERRLSSQELLDAAVQRSLSVLLGR